MTFRNFISDEIGATALEYALVASLIAMVLVAMLSKIGVDLKDTFSEITSAIN